MTNHFTFKNLVGILFATTLFIVVSFAFVSLAHAFGGDAGGTGGGAGDSGGSCCDSPDPTPTPTQPDPNPTDPNPFVVCHLAASPTSITAGGSSALAWSTTNAVSASINQGIGAVALNGSRTVSPSNTTTYTMTVRNSAGNSATCSAKVTVTTPKPIPAPTCVLNANPTSIVSGNSSTLSWTSQNAVSATINQSIGAVALNGSRAVSPSNTTTYTMTVRNIVGVTATCSRTIAVSAPPTPTPPTCTLTANPTTIDRGGSSVLTWSTTNATSVNLHRPNSNNSVANSGSVTVTPWTTFNFVLTATGPGGTVTCSRPVTVIQPPAPVCDISINPTSITKGNSATLSWTSQNAVSATINQGIGAVALNGSRAVSPSNTTTYTMTVKNSAGVEATCARTITVTAVPAPVCESFTAGPSIFNNGTGGTVTLSWNTKNTNSVTINHGVGTFSQAVGSTNTTISAGSNQLPLVRTYTLTAMGADNKSVSCTTQVTVNPKPDPKAPVCESFTATPGAINKGQSATLTWKTTNATSVAINNGIGQVNNNGSVNVSPLKTATYTLTVFGINNQKTTCAATVTVKQPAPAPVCDISINPTSITKGNSATLSWTSQNAVSATINQGIGAVALNGSRAVSPSNTTTYTMTVKNSAGVEATCARTITVTPKPVPAPVCVLNANPTSVVAGNSSTLTWTSQNAISATLDQGIGDVSINGNRTVNPGNTTTYTMTVTNSAGVTATCARTVTVTPAPSAPVCESFTASPTTINRGNNSTLSWTTRNANSVTINNGIGAVGANSSVTVSPQKTTTYTLTASGAGGTITCPVKVTVKTPTPVITCENNVNLSASPSTINRGNSSTVSWSTTGITNLSFDGGITATTLSGSVTVSPSNSTTYTMTASDGSRTISCPVTVNVSVPSSGGGGGGSVVPRCEITASVSNVNRGGAVRLTWTSRNAQDIVVRDNHGNTLVTSKDKRGNAASNLLNDSLTVYPTRDTTYTATVNRGSNERDCTVRVTVNDTLIVQEVRDQKPVVTGIALTEVPYTGFEAGPFMTLAFYTLLVLWALYLAYVLVVRRTPAFASIATDTPTEPNLGQTTRSDVFVSTLETPNFHAPAPIPTPAPTPIIPVQYGYTGGVVNDEVATEVENRAHAAHVLLSGEAMRYFMANTDATNRMNVLDAVLEEAKATYPAEDGWVVLNEERVMKICTVCLANKQAAPAPAFTPSAAVVGNSSLAEAIVTGNIVAAYQLIGNRPMIALADAAADLDALYRAKQGADVTVSKMLAHADVKSDQLHHAITALTGALDGTYTDEAEAVKMAIIKAVKAIHG